MPLRPLRNLLVPSEDTRLVEALRAGDEDAFAQLVDRYHASLVRLARGYVRDRAVAEEVAQETWLGVLNGIDRFEGRSSLKTWIFRILINRAKSRGEREARSVPFSALGEPGEESASAVDPDRFLPPDHPELPGAWAEPPRPWLADPEERLLSGEARSLILDRIAMLPPNQRAVITLRDIEGWSSEDVCNVLDLTDTNQRVLLHRARSRVRQALEDYFKQEDAA